MKVVSLNMNQGRYKDALQFQRQLDFLAGQNADYIFLQEVLDHQVSVLTLTLHMYSRWGCMSLVETSRRGNLILARKRPSPSFETRYGEFDCPGERYEGLENVLVGIFCEELGCMVGCTHLPWSLEPAGGEHQMRALCSLKQHIDQKQIGLLALDANNARVLPNGQPGKIWSGLSEVLSDGVPLNITTTFDPSHRFGNEPTVLDGLFYNRNMVKVTSLTKNTGLSDHCALVAFVEKADVK